MKTGTADLPLHSGRAPLWLFRRMCRLAGLLVEVMVTEHGQKAFLRRVSDPYWFQALSCVLGFDWHSSGTTTTTTGALKVALSEMDLGIAVAGGKGAASRRAPQDIRKRCEEISLGDDRAGELIRASKMAAKVDSALVQDGYQLYHHAFFFTEDGSWTVVQQGKSQCYARRYHWLSEGLRSFVEEPHCAICTERQEAVVLDLTARASRENREACLDLVRDGPDHIRRYATRRSTSQRTLEDFFTEKPAAMRAIPGLIMPRHHPVLPSDLGEGGMKALQMAYQIQPASFEELVALPGIGPRRMRALSLIAELIYGSSPSWKDPARFSFAHGGKDGYPYPVDRETYDRSIETLKEAVDAAKMGRKEKCEAIRRLGLRAAPPYAARSPTDDRS